MDLKDEYAETGITNPEYSDWECFMFGSDREHGIVYNPLKGEEPNWFQRVMSNAFFKCKWVKK